MANLQVKGIDDDLYRALGARAALDNRSVSQEVAGIIRQFLAQAPSDVEKAGRAFLEICGSWKDDRSAAEIAGSVRRARRSRKRSSKASDVFA